MRATRRQRLAGTALGCVLVAASLGPSPRAAQSPGGAAAPRSGTISGKVVSDAGTPIHNATVSVYVADDYAGSQNVEAGDDGTFTFTGLDPASYNVSVYAPGYTLDPAFRSTTHRVGESVTFRLTKGGVITGRVLDAAGKPVVGINVEALVVREVDGDERRPSLAAPTSMTDDLGVYRIYGIAAGTYIVRAGGSSLNNGWMASPFATTPPTFYPSTSRSKAGEVSVRLGEEVTGIDIRFRDEVGHSIKGSVVGADMKGAGWIAVGLMAASDHALVSMTASSPTSGNGSFTLDGIADGEYDLTATFQQKDVMTQSAPRHVVVRGADLDGVQLTVVPLASVAGAVVLEPPADPDPCPESPRRSIRESLVTFCPIDPPASAPLTVYGTARRQSSVDADAKFRASKMLGGRYRVAVDLPDPKWYVKSITAGASKSDVSATGVAVATSAHVDGLVITVARGAATFAGHVRAASEGEALPARCVVDLVPDDAEHADDVNRFFEAEVDDAGSFSLEHLPPGRYRAFARVREARAEGEAARFAWEPAERERLAALGAKGLALDLSACSKSDDAVVPYAPSKGPKP